MSFAISTHSLDIVADDFAMIFRTLERESRCSAREIHTIAIVMDGP